MKTVLLLVCIIAAAGISTAQKRWISDHVLHKRQIDFGEDEICAEILQATECSTGLIQEQVNQLQRCGGSLGDMELLQHECETNAMGVLCGTADVTSINAVVSIRIVCATSDEGNTCTDECRNLLRDVRNELGCCINGNYNSSTSVLGLQDSFRFSLWSNCDVETVDECPDNSGIILPDAEVDQNCDFVVESARAACSRRFIDPLFDALSVDDECADLIPLFQESCGADEAGRSCFDLAGDVLLLFNAASDDCSNTSTCTSFCMASLEDLIQGAGCCVNNLFNGTLQQQVLNSTFDFLSGEFVSQCGGIEIPPGICEAQFNDASFREPASASSTLFRQLTTTVTIAAFLILSSVLIAV